MKSRAAVLTGVNQPWEIMEVDVREPKQNEVLIRYEAAGLCHSDMHLMTGDLPVPLPYIGGHEGAGVGLAMAADPAQQCRLQRAAPRIVDRDLDRRVDEVNGGQGGGPR